MDNNAFVEVLDALDVLESALRRLELTREGQGEKYKLMGFRSYMGEVRKKVQSLYSVRQLRLLGALCGVPALPSRSSPVRLEKFQG